MPWLSVIGGVQYESFDSSGNLTSFRYIGPVFDICAALS